jgi:hypothetical protein
VNANSPRTVAARTLGLVLVVALALSGCSLAANITTSKPYSPSDGVRAEVGPVHAQNLLIVTPAEGDEAVLIGSLTNGSDARVGVVLARANGDGDDVTILVEGHATERIGVAPGRTLIVAASQVAPGGLAEVKLSVKGSDSVTVSVPVVDGTLPEYQGVLDALTAEG